MELRLQELIVRLVTVDMSIDGFLVILVNLIFVNFEQVKCNVIGVTLDGVGKELNLEWSLRHFDEL